MSRDKVFSIAWQLGAALVAIAVGWSALQANVSELQHGKLDVERFVVDSINTSRDLKEIRAGVNEANDRLKEIQETIERRGR